MSAQRRRPYPCETLASASRRRPPRLQAFGRPASTWPGHHRGGRFGIEIKQRQSGRRRRWLALQANLIRRSNPPMPDLVPRQGRVPTTTATPSHHTSQLSPPIRPRRSLSGRPAPLPLCRQLGSLDQTAARCRRQPTSTSGVSNRIHHRTFLTPWGLIVEAGPRRRCGTLYAHGAPAVASARCSPRTSVSLGFGPVSAARGVA